MEYEFDFSELTKEDLGILAILPMISRIDSNGKSDAFWSFIVIAEKYCKTGGIKNFDEVPKFFEDAKAQFQEYSDNYKKDRELI